MYQSSKKSSCNKQTAEPPQSSTLIYIDSANIIFSARTACFELNMMHLLQHLKDSFRSSHIVYFTGKFNKQQDEYDAISDMGIEMVYKQIYNEGQKAKANCDVEIAHRVTLDLLSDPPREIVLLSGDGDFACLYDFAHAS